MAVPVFEIAKDFVFSAAHQIRFHGGKCERLHGHNWRVRVHVRASELNRIGMVVDFADLQKLVAEVGSRFDHQNVNEIPPFDTENTIGLQVRSDDISLGLLKTFRRSTLATVRDDHVRESSVGIYAQNMTRWTDWLRSVVGIRGDYYFGYVNSDTSQNSGNFDGYIPSPKFSLIFGPFHRTEFYLNAGTAPLPDLQRPLLSSRQRTKSSTVGRSA
jgi:queuosine biosynthesis protein QueD